MGSRELIESVQRRLTNYRRLNFALSALCPLFLAALLVALYRHDLVPKHFLIFAIGFVALVTLWFLERTGQLLRSAQQVEAAKLIDSASGAKERFLTLASAGPKSEALPLIEHQADAFAKTFAPEEHVRFALERPAKISSLLTPVLAAALAAFLFSHPESIAPPPAEAKQAASERADQLRELVEKSEALPQTVQDDLLKLASAIEDSGLSSEESLDRLEEAVKNIDDLERAAEQNQPNIEGKEQKRDTATHAPQKESEKEAASHEQTPPPPDQTKGEKQTPPQPPEGAQPPPNEQGQKGSDEQQQSDAAKQQQSKQPSQSKDQQQSEQQKQGGEGRSGSGKQQSQSGESNSEQQASSEQNKDGGKEAKQSDKGGEKQDDPKKDETGVGEGQGKGKSGEKKEQKGETQSGSDENGAKEGNAQNQSGNKQGGESGEGKKQDQKSGKQGNSEQKSGSSGGESKQGSKGSQEGGGKDEQMKEAKAALDQLKQEMQNSQQEKPQQNSTGKQSGDKPGTDPKDLKQGQASGEKQDQKQGDKQGKGSGDQKQPQDQQSPGKSGSDGKKPEQGDQPKSDSEKGSSPSEQKNQQDAQPPESKGEPGAGKNGGDKQRPMKPGENSTKENDGTSLPQDGKAKSQRPNAMPAPSDTAQRFGPFSGGDQGNLSSKEQKTEAVTIPQEEKIVVTNLGSSDGKRYKSDGEAKSKLAISADEFAKPAPDEADSKQPIPVEYRDLLH